MKKKRRRGKKKKREEEKGEERKEGGKSLFLQGALYTFYVHSTILKISTPAAGRHLGFFLASLEKNRPGGLDFFFPDSGYHYQEKKAAMLLFKGVFEIAVKPPPSK